jgi:hypothetical protein
MLNALATRVRQVKAGQGQALRTLRVVPIRGRSRKRPTLRMLEGDALDAVHVTEIDDSGSVAQLRVENTLDTRVFLLDGQELRGAKQNRILNCDVLVPRKSTLTVPVSCVEAGRWAYQSEKFSPGKSASFRIRSAKSRRVSDSLREHGRHDADQAAVWDEVNADLQQSDATSSTAALSDAYAQRQTEFDELQLNLRMPDDAVGLAVFNGGRFLGLDLFDRHATLAYFWQSLVDSYALSTIRNLDVATDETQTGKEFEQVDRLLQEAVAGRWAKYGSPGEGDDFRLDDERLSGSALVWRDRVVLHMQLFGSPAVNRTDANEERDVHRPRLHRRYLRRRQE